MTNAATAAAPTAADFETIKSKQQATWGAGDYGRIGVTLQLTGELLCEALDLRAGDTVLDVAAGNGNVSLAAARRFCKVLSTDYVPELLAQGQQRAQAESLALEFRQADAENLPFAERSFDNVVSTFGVMFTPNQPKAVTELIRTCKSGGKIGLANWTPDGFIGQLFKTIGKHVPPPPGVNSPARWGTREFIHEQFGDDAEDIQINTRQFAFRFQSPQHWLDVFGTYYGPTLKAIEAAVDPDLLRNDILALINRFNAARDGSMVVPSEYLEIVITRDASR